jgi:hypothetical protein
MRKWAVSPGMHLEGMAPLREAVSNLVPVAR